MTKVAVKPQLRDRVVSAALDLAKREGEGALSMRRVASEANCALSSVYRVVDDRDDLISAMLDSVAARIVHPPRHPDPADEIAAIFATLRGAMCDDPWIVSALAANDRGSLHALPLIERVFVALERYGLSIEEARDIYRGLIACTFGDVLIEVAQARGGTSPKQRLTAADMTGHDALLRATQAKPYDSGAFETNVRRLIRGAVVQTGEADART